MNTGPALCLVALVLQLVLGLAVIQANPRRKPNQCFLLLSVAIAMWLGCLYLGLSTRSNTTLEFSIREASAAGALILTTSNLLRLSTLSQQGRWRDILQRSLPWLTAVLAIIVLCQTRFFLIRATFSQAPGSSIALPAPLYGDGVVIYILYFLLAGAATIISSVPLNRF